MITLRNIYLNIASRVIFENMDMRLEKGERVALIGRNGTGKSTLIKMLTGVTTPDSGEIVIDKGVRICQLSQDIPVYANGYTIHDVVLAGFGELGSVISEYDQLIMHPSPSEQGLERLSHLQNIIDDQQGWQVKQQVDSCLTKMKLDGSLAFESCSGGLKRRVLLAQALAQSPDLLLLDEPTNHLDIQAISWLEDTLKSYSGTVLFVTHDRTFLDALATRILSLDRGILRSYPGRYEAYQKQKAAEIEAEEREQALFLKKLSQEEQWIRQGIKARRTRNEGRVRSLEAMREKKSNIRQQMGNVSLTKIEAEHAAKCVITAEDVGLSYDGDHYLFRHLSLLVTKGEKIGIIGPNGVGKTSLIQVLLGKTAPTEGSIKLARDLTIGYLDQVRDQLDLEANVLDNVAGGRTHIEINGQSIHVYSYLQQFLFTPERSRSKVSSLSGGERNRVLLAKVLSIPHHILILDEPTNDLDLETLEVLETLLVNYTGTLIVISHDREFLNRVASSSLAFDEDGGLREYVGGYNDWLRQRPNSPAPQTIAEKTEKHEKSNEGTRDQLSSKERKQLEALPQEIEALEEQLEALTQAMSDPTFYEQDKEAQQDHQSRVSSAQNTLLQRYELWETLEARSYNE